MRKIAVMEDFLTKAHMEKLRAATERLGFAVDFYPKNVLPDEKAGEYEVIYGNCDPGLLKKATGLKWIRFCPTTCTRTRTCCSRTPPGPMARRSPSTS